MQEMTTVSFIIITYYYSFPFQLQPNANTPKSLQAGLEGGVPPHVQCCAQQHRAKGRGCVSMGRDGLQPEKGKSSEKYCTKGMEGQSKYGGGDVQPLVTGEPASSLTHIRQIHYSWR